LDVISPEHKLINGGSPYITSQLCKDELRPIQNHNMLSKPIQISWTTRYQVNAFEPLKLRSTCLVMDMMGWLEFHIGCDKASTTTIKPYPTKCGPLHRSNYDIMFYHIPYFDQTH
jgi:hypothetical protein